MPNPLTATPFPKALFPIPCTPSPAKCSPFDLFAYFYIYPMIGHSRRRLSGVPQGADKIQESDILTIWHRPCFEEESSGLVTGQANIKPARGHQIRAIAYCDNKPERP
jgi:hypothetical protein